MAAQLESETVIGQGLSNEPENWLGQRTYRAFQASG